MRFIILLTLNIIIASDFKFKNYQFYIFAVQWPYAQCKDGSKNCEYLDMFDNSNFNIHGLWPSSQRNNPFACNQKIKYNPTYLGDELVKNLETNWSAIYNSHSKFLNHELTKHGSCLNPFLETNIKDAELNNLLEIMRNDITKSSKNKKLSNRKFNYFSLFNSDLISSIFSLFSYDSYYYDLFSYGYFKINLNLQKKYNLKKILSNFRMNPGNRYLTIDLIKGLKGYFGKECFKIYFNKIGHYDYIREIRLCLDLNFEPYRCNFNASLPESFIYLAPFKN